MASDDQVTTPEQNEEVNVVNEVNDEIKVGEYVGQCKWFNDRYGYGFITIQTGEEKGKDIFVHHTGVKPLNSNYKTLKKGEYVNFNIVNGENGLQAVDVTGIGGGSLMCDVMPSIKYTRMPIEGEIPVPPVRFTTVTYNKRVPAPPPTRRPFNNRSNQTQPV
jgi:cold shock CspA family protein